jgi:hypothetical protein
VAASAKAYVNAINRLFQFDAVRKGHNGHA